MSQRAYDCVLSILNRRSEDPSAETASEYAVGLQLSDAYPPRFSWVPVASRLYIEITKHLIGKILS